MMRLFSSFDFYFFRFLRFIVSYVISYCFWNNNILKFLTKLHQNLIKYFKSLSPFKFKLLDLIFCSIFFLVGYLNLISVFSYYFPLTSQISFNLFFSLTLWWAVVSFRLYFDIKSLLSHLIPEGTPFSLIFLLFIIEIVRIIIRPLTLIIRLLANIMAGHLLIVLLGKVILIFPSSIALLIILSLVEIFVSLIQAYILVSLACLYFRDIR